MVPGLPVHPWPGCPVVHGAGILHTSLAACLVLLLGIMVGFCRMLRPTSYPNTNYGSRYSKVSTKYSDFDDFCVLKSFGLTPMPPEDRQND